MSATVWRMALAVSAAVLLTISALFAARPVAAQDLAVTDAARLGGLTETLRTESPRDTLETFRRLTERLEQQVLDYIAAPSRAGAAGLALLSDQFISLLQLDTVSAAARRETGVRTYSILIDIFGRIGLPDPTEIPDLEAIEAEGTDVYRIPNTPLRLVRIAEGEREGEFLFAESTVQIAPRVLGTIRDLPMTTRLDTDSVTVFGKQLTGPLVPPGIVRAVPPSLKALWLDTPIWKVLGMGVLVAATIALLVALHRVLRRIRPSDRLLSVLVRMLMPFIVIATAKWVIPFLSAQLNVSGRFATGLAKAETVVAYLALAWIVWLGVRLVVEWIIRSPRIADESFDAGILRLASAVVGVVGVAIVLAFGGQAIGLPIMSILAGFGIGGIAVALAIRPTLENLIGGVILYVDRPVSVGDFCSFGDQTGTVEEIGVRSTKLRALDRTLISVPNAQFADMQIINWAECDEMLIKASIGLRHETSPDQLRFVLAELRRMLHAHPRVNPDTVRVRFSGFGEGDLKIDIRVYVMTREWNDFFAVREDVYLRVFELVAASGTDLAFPSRTLYLGRDGGLDPERGKAAEAAVAGWRRSGRLPFPRLTPEEIAQLRGTLDYPARGSPEAGTDDARGAALAAGAEPLSAPVTEEKDADESTAAPGQPPDRPKV